MWFDRNGLDEPQDVVEYSALDWSKHGKYHEQPHRAGTGLGLSVDWYRDVLRSKLVSLRLPRRLLQEYREKVMMRNDCGLSIDGYDIVRKSDEQRTTPSTQVWGTEPT